MKKYLHPIMLLVFVLITSFTYSQVKQDVNALKKQLAFAHTDIEKFKVLDLITNDYIWYSKQTDSLALYAKEEFQLGSRINQPYYLSQSYLNIGWYFLLIGNIGPEIEEFTKSIHLALEKNCPMVLIKAYHALSVTYMFTGGDLELVKEYARKAEKLLPYENDSLFHYGALVNGSLAYYYMKNNKLDSALKYANKGNEEAIKYPEPYSRAVAMGVLAQVYDKREEYDLANAFFTKSMIVMDTLESTAFDNIQIRYAESLYRQEKFKDAIKNAYQGLSIARKSNDLVIAHVSALDLYKAYNADGRKDSAFYYLQMYFVLDDSILSDEKKIQIKNITVSEQIHNKEQEAKSVMEAIQRKHNIQYAAIAICLISFTILYLLLSQSIINAKLVIYLGLLGLLIGFEFINLVTHPFISSFTNDNPFIMLLILVAIGALLIPLHHRLENWITYKLVEKNKRLKEEKLKKLVAAYQAKNKEI